MSTAPVSTEVVVHKTWLQKAGDSLRKWLHIGIEVAEDAEPLVDVSVPAVGALYNGTVGLFVQSEAAFRCSAWKWCCEACCSDAGDPGKS